ncbi:uncharacterized protein TNCV_1095051 [Trichonephila clavipes]|nr:uncharacterized protein TNCV_1095051 [Trichonephila clavipes]
MSETYDFLFKFLVIGSAGTGKSCLLHQFIESKCLIAKRMTVGALPYIFCEVNGRCTLVPCASIGWWDGLPPAWDQAIDTFADSCVKGGGLHRDVFGWPPKRPGAPLKEQNFSSLKQQMSLKTYITLNFFVIHRTEGDTFSSVSPFLIQKGLSATVGSVKAVSKMRSGDLLVEISTTKQAEQLLALQMLANIPITVLPHANLNSSRGVISESDLYNVPEQEILEGLQDQSYLRCSVRPYIPNPLRCFQCQRFGHSKPTCRGKPTCARCGAVGHDSGRITWNLEKEIITVKIKNRLTYPEARLAVTNRTPIQGLSYAAVAKKVTTSSEKKPGKRILEDCEEANSLYESTPVSKRSRRRKTSQTSDAMDTDVNPSDTDYVIGQASEEDESLFEANFKQAMSNPLTGTLLPLSPKR